MRYAKALLVVAILVLAGWVYLAAVPSTDSTVGASGDAPATQSADAKVERQIADLLIDSLRTGEAVEEDPRLWELVRQLEPDHTVVLDR